MAFTSRVSTEYGAEYDSQIVNKRTKFINPLFVERSSLHTLADN